MIDLLRNYEYFGFPSFSWGANKLLQLELQKQVCTEGLAWKNPKVAEFRISILLH
jgi:hypothetical protein